MEQGGDQRDGAGKEAVGGPLQSDTQQIAGGGFHIKADGFE